MTTNRPSIGGIDSKVLANHFLNSGLQASRFSRALKSPIKNMIISLMRRTGNHKKVKCSTVFGVTFFGYIPEAVTSLIWRFGVYEPETSIFLLDNVKEGDVFLDVGAHFGYFSLFASELVGPTGKVVSIEAMPTTYSMLSKNINSNNKRNVQTFQFAAGNESGQVQFRDYGVINSSLNTFVASRGVLNGNVANFSSVNVETKRIDKFFNDECLPHPQFVKIDAESSEHLVLEGMASILENDHPPVLLIEMGGGDSNEDSRARAIYQSLDKYGYQLFKIEGRQLVAASLEGQVPYFNGVFIPHHLQHVSRP